MKTATKKPKPTEKKKPTRKRTKAKPKTDAKASSVRQFDKEINDIRQAQNKPEKDPEKLKKELEDVVTKADDKAYLNYVKNKMQRAKNDDVKLSEAEVIKLAIAIRPLVQSLRGTLADVKTTNRKVLAPNFNNLLRWSNDPGQYDLAGADIAKEAKVTIEAKPVKNATIFSILGLN